MPTLLITGGAGFIGGHTATMAIQRGWQVRLLDNLSTGLATKADKLASEGAEVIIGDVRDKNIVQDAVEGCDAVVHLAAQVSVPRSVEQPEETLEINVDGTANLLNACKMHRVSRFVMASSAAVYGTNDAFPLDETHAGTFHSPYAESKWTNEHQVAEAKASGLEAVALRFFNVYGTGQRSDGAYAAVIPKFIELAVAGQAPTVFGDGQQTRDFVHVDDVSRALLMLATDPWANDLDTSTTYAPKQKFRFLTYSMASTACWRTWLLRFPAPVQSMLQSERATLDARLAQMHVWSTTQPGRRA